MIKYGWVINFIDKMGNEQCSDCKETSLETHAYGTHEILQ